MDARPVCRKAGAANLQFAFGFVHGFFHRLLKWLQKAELFSSLIAPSNYRFPSCAALRFLSFCCSLLAC